MTKFYVRQRLFLRIKYSHNSPLCDNRVGGIAYFGLKTLIRNRINNNNNNNNQTVHTDKEVTGNRSDKIIKNKKEKTCTLIYVAIPTDRNVV
jgi:hypothetical protein